MIGGPPSGSRAPRCRFDNQPDRRPLPHSTPITTRSRVCSGLIFCQLFPRRPALYGDARSFTIAPSCPAASEASRCAAASSGVGRTTDGIRCGPATRPSAASRSSSGASRRSTPSRWRQSKNHGDNSRSPSAEPNRLIVSWNGRGRPESASARVSPSRTTVSHGNPRTSSTSSGTDAVMSRSVRVTMTTSSPERWTWMRAPSSLYSTTTSGPSESIASSMVAPGEASMGRMGRPTTSPTASSVCSPPEMASAAVRARSPDSITARRTTAASTPDAAAIASVITPSSAPWRSSPVMSPIRNSCSDAVAAPSSAPSASFRRCAEPAPVMVVRPVSARSTPVTVSVGSSAGAGRAEDRVRHPIPIRPWRVSPASQATVARTSSGDADDSTAASSDVFALRERVAATRSEASTTDARRVTGAPVPRCRRTASVRT